MRLNVPPTLKQSSLMDSNLLTPRSSQSNKNPNSPRFIQKQISKVSNAYSQFQNQNLAVMASYQQKSSKKQLASPYRQNFKKGNSMNIDNKFKGSSQQFLKNMPLFNQYQTQSNLSEIKISQIPKHQNDYLQEFQDEEICLNLSPKLKRKSSSNDIVNYTKQNSPKVINKGLKRLNSMDVINEEENSTNSNSLTGSKNFQTNSVLNSLKKGGPSFSQTKFTGKLQVIQQINKQKNGITQSQYQNTQLLDEPSRIQSQLQQLRNNNTIQISQISSQRQVDQNDSMQSLKTVNLAKKLANQQKKNNKNKQKNNLLTVNNNSKIQLKLQQIQKSLKLQNNQQSYYDISRTQTQQTIPSVRLQSKKLNQMFHKNNQKNKQTNRQIQDNCPKKDGQNSQTNIFSQMNQRFKKIKEIKNGGSTSTKPQSNFSTAKVQNITPTSNFKKFADKSIQTDIQLQKSKPINDTHSIHSQYSSKIDFLQRQNSKLRKQVRSFQENTSQLEFMKNKFEEENAFLNQKIKRLERILQKNERQLQQWKQIAKEGQSAPKNHPTPIIKLEKTQNQDEKQKIYLQTINKLQKQIQRINSNNNRTDDPKSNSENKIKRDQQNTKNYQYINRLYKYQQNLAKNMILIKKQQQKILKQWRIIEEFYKRNRINERQNNYYQRDLQSQWARKQQYTYGRRYDDKQDAYQRDYDVVSLGQKIKSMRNQIAKDTR